jgi:hypothetical protein
MPTIAIYTEIVNYSLDLWCVVVYGGYTLSDMRYPKGGPLISAPAGLPPFPAGYFEIYHGGIMARDRFSAQITMDKKKKDHRKHLQADGFQYRKAYRAVDG